MKGKKNGHGIHFYSSGAKYEGNWEENKAHGSGALIYPNGDNYMGDFVDGRKKWKGGI